MTPAPNPLRAPFLSFAPMIPSRSPSFRIFLTSRPSQDPIHKFPLNPTPAEDLAWLGWLCHGDGKGDAPFFTDALKSKHCANAFHGLVERKKHVLEAIASVDGLEADRKAKMSERAESLFAALESFK